jgi:AcrR family transcriptional regulator
MSARLESATRHDEKLQQILKASAEIFADKGFDSTSIRDIARATGMSLAGLYYYFRTKEELLCLIQEQCLLTLLDNWEKSSSEEKPARNRVGLFVENHLGFFLHNMNEMKVMSHEDRSLTGEYRKRVLGLKRRYVKILMDLVEELQQEEKVEKLHVRVAALSLFGMMNWIYTWYNPDRDLPLASLIEQMLRIYFFGVLRGGSIDDPLFNEPADHDKEHYALWHTRG